MTPAKRETVLVNFLEFDGPLSTRALAAKTGWDQNTVGADLKRLFETGVVDRTENKRWRWEPKTSRFVWRLA